MFDTTFLSYLIGPLVGAIIGYITNDIAIRMLFRPHKAVHIGRIRLPFTPGLIPKERYRISKSIGETIAKELLSGEVVRGALLADDVRCKIEYSVDSIMQKASEDERRMAELLPGGEHGEWRTGLDSALDNIGNELCGSLLSSGFEQSISTKVIGDLRLKLAHSPISPLRLFWDDNFSSILSNKLSRGLSEFAERNAPELVRGILGKTTDDILGSRIMDLYEKHEESLANLRNALLSQYESLISNQIDNMLRAIDIRNIVEERINSLEVKQLEEMTFTLMKRELRAIIWLGALLGGIMGTITSFI